MFPVDFKKALINLIGWFSVLLILVAYALLTFEVVGSRDLTYNAMNLLGATGLAWRVFQDKNWSNFFLEVCFILIAVYAIGKYFINT